MRKFLIACLLAGSIGGSFVLPTRPAQAIPVFDSANYSQNLLTAARTLQQVNQQIQSLQNEAAMLVNMDKHLKNIDFPELQKLTDNLKKVEQLMAQAQGVDFNVGELDTKLKSLFPKEFAAGSRESRVQVAKARLDAAMSAFHRNMGVQARIVANVNDDAQMLTELSAKSQNAVGNLQVGQATNQLLALAAKQQMQLQQMIAAQFQAESIERARAAQTEAEARAATKRFLGTGKAYTSG